MFKLQFCETLCLRKWKSKNCLSMGVQAEIVETTLVIFRFRFLRVGSHINTKRYDGEDTNKNLTKTTSMRRKVGKTKVVSTISALRVLKHGILILNGIIQLPTCCCKTKRKIHFSNSLNTLTLKHTNVKTHWPSVHFVILYHGKGNQ